MTTTTHTPEPTAILAPFNDTYPKPEHPEFYLMSITERMVYMTREKITSDLVNCEFYCSVDNVAEAMLAASRINESLLPGCKETYENPPIPVDFCGCDVERRELKWEVYPTYDAVYTDSLQRVAFFSLQAFPIGVSDV